jgi:HD superfamily phosphohydrolase
LEWILEHLDYQKRGRRHFFFVTSKAFLTAEAYVFARYHMYRTVYFHKTTRAAEVMLKLLFQRLKALVSRFDPKDACAEMAKIAPGIPAIVVNSFRGALDLHQYLELDDFTLSEFFKACGRSSDSHLRELGGGLLHRRLFKGIDMTASIIKAPNLMVRVTDLLRRKEPEPEFVFGEDTPADTPYKPYDPDAEKPARQIYVENDHGTPVEISTLSEPITSLRKRYQLVRYYFPERYREEVRRIQSEL